MCSHPHPSIDLRLHSAQDIYGAAVGNGKFDNSYLAQVLKVSAHLGGTPEPTPDFLCTLSTSIQHAKR